MKYYVIGDEDTCLGFSLVGISSQSVSTAQEAKDAWAKALEDRQNAIIIITESVANMIRETVDRYLFSEDFPLVVEIPDAGGASSRDLRSLVNEAIGVSL